MKSLHFLPRLVTAALLMLLALSGCASLPPVQSGTLVAPDVGQALLDEWLATSARHRSLQGLAKVKVQAGERSASGTQVILAEAPDRLRAETLSPFGTPLLVLATAGGELTVLVPGENRFYRGAATPENLGRFTRLPLHLEDLVDILLVRPPLISPRSMNAYRLADGGWRIELDAGAHRQLLAFDADRQLVEVQYLEYGELRLRLDYGAFDADLAGFPRRIGLFIPRQQIQAGLVFSELVMDREFQPELFVVPQPPGAATVELDEEPSAETAAGDAPPPAQAGAR